MGVARSLVLASSLLVVLGVTAGTAAGAKGGHKPPAGPTGYDISYPQCGVRFPTNVLFGIVGVNDGIVYKANPCLGTGDGSSELAWAEQYEPAAILYVNTADPGPALSTHWPKGQTAPQYCDPLQPDSLACSYDYGWNAAADSYQDAVNAYISIGKLLPGATATPSANEWWLDVESANSWEANTFNNVSALQGEVDYLASRGATAVGVYSSRSDWQSITGGTTSLSSHPSWLAGAGSQNTAQSFCGTTGFTGGAVKYSQYASNGLDADVRC